MVEGFPVYRWTGQRDRDADGYGVSSFLTSASSMVPRLVQGWSLSSSLLSATASNDKGEGARGGTRSAFACPWLSSALHSGGSVGRGEARGRGGGVYTRSHQKTHLLVDVFEGVEGLCLLVLDHSDLGQGGCMPQSS